VTVNYLVSWSSVGGATGNIQCLNLPFTSVNVAGNFVSFIWTDANIAFASGAGNVPVGILAPGNNYWFPYAYNQTTGGNSQIAIPSTGGITATIIYETE
jgi:polygalacturonase